MLRSAGHQDVAVLDGDFGPLLQTQKLLDSVEFARAKGTKCARSWKILPTVGDDPVYPDVSPRDAQALREWDATPKAAE